MVSNDRAQLLLIGAIALAFIVLGIVVVFNGVLVTETISASQTSQSTGDATATDGAVEREIEQLGHRLNFNEGWEPGDAEAILDEGGGFGDRLQQTTALSRPVLVDVTYEDHSDASAIEESVESGEITFDGEAIGHLVLNLSSADELTVTQNDGDESENTTIVQENGEFGIEASDCAIRADTVRFDLVSGTVDQQFVDDCDADAFAEEAAIVEYDQSYDNVTFSGDASGTYELVTRGEFNGETPGETTPRDGLWEITISTQFESNELSYEHTEPIEIYGGDP